MITNGRGTFPYTLKALESQSVPIKVTVISDMVWVDALRKCVELSESSFYLRVDDDMFLHKHAVAYYLYMLRKTRRVGVYECKFWEDWSGKPAGSLKAYKTKVVKQLGFHPSKLGKVDKTFSKSLEKTKYQRVKDPSMIGLHALGSVEDQKRYRSLWRDKNATISRDEFAKTFDNIIHPNFTDLENQYSKLSKIPRINKKYNTRYYKFLKK